MFYIYILFSVYSNQYYVGYTRHVEQRLRQHNFTSADSFTAKHRPWMLKAVFAAGSQEDQAIRMERFIKKQKSRHFIERLIDQSFIPDRNLAQLVRVPHLRD